MGEVNRNTLKTYFNTGDKPTEAQFVDLIDSNLNRVNDFSTDPIAFPNTNYIAERPVLDTVRQRAIFDREAIKKNAGIPGSITVGVESGVTVGLSDAGALVADESISITSEADAASESSSGSGTEADPYIIEDKEFDNSESATRAFLFTGSDSYYLKIRNCRMFGYSQLINHSADGLNLILENCELYNSAGDIAVSLGNGAVNGSVKFDKTECKGVNKFLIRHGSNTAGNAFTIEFDNVDINDDNVSWSQTDSSVISMVGSLDVNLVINNITVDGSTVKPLNFINSVSPINSITGQSWYIRVKTDAISVSTNPTQNIDVKYLDIRGQDNHAIYASYVEDSVFDYCDFGPSATKSRLVRFFIRGSDPYGANDVEVKNSIFEETQGDGTAGSEVLEAFDSKFVSFHDNYCVQCTEDAFELVDCTDSEIYNCVGEDVVGQIVDLFAETPGNGARNKVHHIYGDCGGVPVILTDNDDVICHDVYAESTVVGSNNGGVLIQQRNYTSGAGPNNCHVSGPLPLSSSISSGLPFATDGTLGTGNSAVWEEDGQIQTFGDIDDTKQLLR